MKEKERYFSPASEVMELRLEGVIAVSGGGVNPAIVGRDNAETQKHLPNEGGSLKQLPPGIFQTLAHGDLDILNVLFSSHNLSPLKHSKGASFPHNTYSIPQSGSERKGV